MSNSYNFYIFIQMNVYKKQNIQKLIVDQAGAQRLILNDLILGRDGAQAFAQLIPQYHTNLLHLEVKGNNIDSQGFQMVFYSLLNCPNLITIQAEWNNIGSSPAGLMALLHLVRNLRFLQLIDLKNNKISHLSAQIISEIIKNNLRSLKVLDLRWNDLGQVGAQTIYSALAFNSSLKHIGLQDNRISSNTLIQIGELLKNTSRGTLNLTGGLANKTAINQTISANYFPITDQSYPSMEVQLKAGQLRGKIQSEQQQTIIQQQKIQLQIQKVIQKIRVKGSQIHQAQLKFDFLSNENVNLINNMHEGQRMLGVVREKFMGLDQTLNSDKSSLRTEKYQANSKIQIMMEKTIQRQQRQLEDLIGVMNQKHQRLNAYLKDRTNDKRANREKLAEIKQDIIKFKLSKESIWDKVALTTSSANKSKWEDQILALEDLIAKSESGLKTQKKKSEYLEQQLTNFVMRGLKKQQKYEQDIFQIQNVIKDLHKQMTMANVDIEEKNCQILLKEAEIIDKQANVDLSRRYVKFVQSQNSVNLDIERLKNDQDTKAQRFNDQMLQLRISDVQRAVRQQQAQNKMIKNHYDKILAQLQAISKATIQNVLFQG